MNAIKVSSRTAVPSAAVIFFHGLGDSGNGWKFLSDLARRSPLYDHINFVFPNAPEMPISANGGYKMPGWFDIFQFEENAKLDTKGFTDSLEVVDKLIKEQLDLGIKSDNIIIGGFSQGGGLAIGTLVRSDKKLGGIIALSPFIPFHDALREWNPKSVNKATPIFHGHGRDDTLIPIAASDKNEAFLTKELGYTHYTYKTYPVEHAVDNDELIEVLTFIKDKLPKPEN